MNLHSLLFRTIPAVILATCTAHILLAGTSSDKLQFPPVQLKVIVTDSNGQPVKDLSASDFSVVDNGAKQAILSAKASETKIQPRVAVLIDFLNLNFSERAIIANEINRVSALPGIPALSLYLLLPNGGVWVVRDMMGQTIGPSTKSNSSNATLPSLLAQALGKVPQVRAGDQSHVYVRAQTTYKGLATVCDHLAKSSGPKALIWITYGTPSSIRLRAEGYRDLTPQLLELAAYFNAGNTAVYSVDPGKNLMTGLLQRDGLEVLTQATGGRALQTSDLEAAISRVESDAIFQYAIAYTPFTKDNPRHIHNVRVLCEHKGVRLQTQEAYFSDSGK